MDKIETRIVKPTIEGLQKDGIPYKGFVFIGLINVNNEPIVIEYNVRMGDPETSGCSKIKNRFSRIILAANEKLDEITLEIDEKCNNGYGGVRWIPEEYEKEK
jgi:phosphoribosylamine--glycine ligase